MAACLIDIDSVNSNFSQWACKLALGANIFIQGDPDIPLFQILLRFSESNSARDLGAQFITLKKQLTPFHINFVPLDVLMGIERGKLTEFLLNKKLRTVIIIKDFAHLFLEDSQFETIIQLVLMKPNLF